MLTPVYFNAYSLIYAYISFYRNALAFFPFLFHTFALTLSWMQQQQLTTKARKKMHSPLFTLLELHRSILFSCMNARHTHCTILEKKKKKKEKQQQQQQKKSQLRISSVHLFGYVTKHINLSTWTLSMKIGCNNKHHVYECELPYISSILLFNQFSVPLQPCLCYFFYSSRLKRISSVSIHSVFLYFVYRQLLLNGLSGANVLLLLSFNARRMFFTRKIRTKLFVFHVCVCVCVVEVVNTNR